jgi:hypothetical protein
MCTASPSCSAMHILFAWCSEMPLNAVHCNHSLMLLCCAGRSTRFLFVEHKHLFENHSITLNHSKTMESTSIKDRTERLRAAVTTIEEVSDRDTKQPES